MDSKGCRGMDLELYTAARDGNMEFFRKFKDRESTLKTITPLENTALHIASIYGHTEFAGKLLCKRPFLLRQRNKEGNTALQFAARGGHESLIKLLTGEYKKLGDTDDVEAQQSREPQRDFADKAPLVSTESQGEIKEEKKERGIELKLIRAAKEGNTEIFEDIKDGEDTNTLKTLDSGKNTALHTAAKYGREDFAHKLLSKCPSLLRLRNGKGNTALYFAVRGGHESLIKLLTEEYSKLGATDNVEAQHHTESLRDLEDETPQVPIEPLGKATINLENNEALHEALKNRHTMVVLLLLTNEPEMARSVNRAKESPLYLAAQQGLLAVVEKIVSKKSLSFSTEGPSGRTPLHAAVIGNHSDIVKLLVEKVPNIITQGDYIGKTVLHFAAELNFVKIIKLLLKKDRTLGYAIDEYGRSPLHIAAEKGHSHAVVAILNCCPDSVELLNASGRNALHLAVAHNSYFNVTIIRIWWRPEVKVLINGRDKDGNTPLHLASKRTLLPAVVLLSTVRGVHLAAINKEGYTPEDIKSSTVIFIRQVIIRRYLRFLAFFLGQGSIPKTRSKSARRHTRDELLNISQSLSVVATLLAAVTFAAAFTMPGGYESQRPDIGKPLLLERIGFFDKLNFSGFLVCDIIAAFSSTIATILLVRGMLGDGDQFDDEHLFLMIRRSWYLLMFAFSATTLAFIFTIDAILPFTVWRAFGVGTLLLLAFIFIYFL